MSSLHRLARPVARIVLWVAMFLIPAVALAEGAAFDLIGPPVEVTVTRAGVTLPIAEVPNLMAGDRVWIHPALPDDQQARYLMVVAFLRGATNPPPDAWFTRAETWTKFVRQEGVVVTVPAGAQQALIFLAPQTGGDFVTLRSAVQGKPGAFVRAAQDLQLISLNRARLEKYLSAIREEQDPKTLHEHALTLARSLSIKVDESCFLRPVLQQASCLMQHGDQLVLDDGHGQSMVSTLTEGAGGDLLGAISNTRMAGGGAYSPYVGVVVDLARLMENLHTAKYQYISSLALPQGDQLRLRLNYPPSFHKPQSVIVIGLPAVQPAVPPVMHPVTPEAVACAQNPSLVLAADGAPLVFSSELAHHLMLHLEGKDGHAMEIPVTANALAGGFVPAIPVSSYDWLPLAFTGRVHGQWGFQSFDGPTYKLQRTDPSARWAVSEPDQALAIAGHDRTLHIHSANSTCIEQVSFRLAKGEAAKIEWKALADAVEIHLPLEKAAAGESALLLKQFGVTQPSEIPLRIYKEDCHLNSFQIHAADAEGKLSGTCLDRVDALEVAGLRFLPSAASSAAPVKDAITLHAETSLNPPRDATQLTAHATLKDGRTLEVHAAVLPPRPHLQLIGKSIELAASPIHLNGPDDLPADARLHFRLKSETPFAPTEKVEVSSADGFYHEELTLESGGLIRQNARTIMATLMIPRGLAASAFGALRFRAVSPEGYEGDWQPLATLVRLPEITDVRCSAAKDAPCTVTGNNLFLIQSLSVDEDFQHPVEISENLMAPSLDVPHPKGKVLYLKLRDDPSRIQILDMPARKDATLAHKDEKKEDKKDDSKSAKKVEQEKDAQSGNQPQAKPDSADAHQNDGQQNKADNQPAVTTPPPAAGAAPTPVPPQ
jgi:hypothetical protein